MCCQPTRPNPLLRATACYTPPSNTCRCAHLQMAEAAAAEKYDEAAALRDRLREVEAAAAEAADAAAQYLCPGGACCLLWVVWKQAGNPLL